MPTKIYFDGNASVLVKGETEKAAIRYGNPLVRWLKKTAQAVATNGHELKFVKRRALCFEFQPDAEFQANIADQQRREAAAAAELATRRHCRRCGSDSPHESSFCGKCGAALVKKDEPRLTVPGR